MTKTKCRSSSRAKRRRDEQKKAVSIAGVKWQRALAVILLILGISIFFGKVYPQLKPRGNWAKSTCMIFQAMEQPKCAVYPGDAKCEGLTRGVVQLSFRNLRTELRSASAYDTFSGCFSKGSKVDFVNHFTKGASIDCWLQTDDQGDWYNAYTAAVIFYSKSFWTLVGVCCGLVFLGLVLGIATISPCVPRFDFIKILFTLQEEKEQQRINAMQRGENPDNPRDPYSESDSEDEGQSRQHLTGRQPTVEVEEEVVVEVETSKKSSSQPGLY